MAKAQTSSPEREPFKLTDFTKNFADFNRMFADYGKLFTNGKSPLFDVEHELEGQRPGELEQGVVAAPDARVAHPLPSSALRAHPVHCPHL